MYCRKREREGGREGGRERGGRRKVYREGTMKAVMQRESRGRGAAKRSYTTMTHHSMCMCIYMHKYNVRALFLHWITAALTRRHS